ncbi:MAG: HRDC domain-containing protein [Planctomycetota bacterium]
MTSSDRPTTDPAALPPPTFVDTQRGLDEMLARLADEPTIAVDTEADSFFAYRESVCLIQLTAGGSDYVLDPLAKVDLDGLGALLADEARVKIFHDGEYDVLIFKRNYGFEFRNLFDTRVAAATLGSKTPGLASVLEERFGVQLDKSQQRSNWAKRPLTREQIQYARLDTHYLIRLRELMLADLEAAGRLAILEGECRRLEGLEPPVRPFDAEEFARIKGARQLPSTAWAPLRELYVWREREAERRNLPPFKVLANPILLELATLAPESPSELRRVRSLPEKLRQRLGGELLAALTRARASGPMERFPRLPAKDGTTDFGDAEHELHDRAKAWRRRRAEQEDLDSSLILHRTTILDLALRKPRSRAEVEALDGIVPWQVEAYADRIIALVEKFERELAAGEIDFTKRRRARRG